MSHWGPAHFSGSVHTQTESSHTEVAAVFDGDRFLGMVSMKQISREIVQ